MREMSNSIMLDVQNLNKRFGSVHAVKDLSFNIRKGEIFGFLGPNGAGKTTTMRIITCFIPPSSGTVKIDGLDIAEHDLEVRRKIGYLPETTPLYADMLVPEYLEFVAAIHGIPKTKIKTRTDEMLTVCGLTAMTKRQIGKLSKGFRQRVGLAQAMINDPELLILDEPMSGLDPNQIIEIRGLIKQIGKAKTVIYCSHILSEVAATCNRILIINNGSIVATGTPDELTAKSSRNNRYLMRVKAPRDAITPALAVVDGVSVSEIKDDGDGWHIVNMQVETNADISEQLFSCAVGKGWMLSELKRETASLEDVFTQLTRSKIHGTN